MDIVQLQYFQTIARFQHLTKAAEYLNISQPALSVSLSKLEKEVGTNLFDRNGRNISLNECGKIYLQYVDAALMNMTNARTEISEHIKKNKGTLTLYMTCKAGFEKYLLGFRTQHPEIVLRRYEIFASDIESSIERESCDFITVVEYSPESRGCHCEILSSDDLLLVVNKKNPLAQRKSVEILDLKDEKFIVLPSGYSYRILTDSICRDVGFECNILHECFLCQLFACVSHGLGVSIVTESLVRSPCNSQYYDNLAFIPITGSNSTVKTALIWPEKKLLSREAQLFLDYVRQAKEEPSDRDGFPLQFCE